MKHNINRRFTFKIKKSFTMALVNNWDNQNRRGKAANHVKMKLKGSGNCIMTMSWSVEKQL